MISIDSNIVLLKERLTMNKEMMTIDDVAKYLKLSISTIRGMIKMEKIPAIKIGKMWRFEKERIDQWIENKNVLKEKKTN